MNMPGADYGVAITSRTSRSRAFALMVADQKTSWRLLAWQRSFHIIVRYRRIPVAPIKPGLMPPQKGDLLM